MLDETARRYKSLLIDILTTKLLEVVERPGSSFLKLLTVINFQPINSFYFANSLSKTKLIHEAIFGKHQTAKGVLLVFDCISAM